MINNYSNQNFNNSFNSLNNNTINKNFSSKTNSKNKNKKGFVLISTILVILLMSSFTIILQTVLYREQLYIKREQNIIQKNLIINQIRNDFLDNQIIDNTYDYDVNIYTENQTSLKKALVVKSKKATDKTDIIYLLVYDFNTNSQICSQTSNFYLSTVNVDNSEMYYIADTIPYV